MKDLVDRNLVQMRAGDIDRRQRLLRLTDEGSALETALYEEQRERMAKAYNYAGQDAVAGYWAVMEALIPLEARAQIAALGSSAR
jgi:DNA-binding MarR family transcriptional regulator